MGVYTWTQEDDARLIELATDGLSYQAIADRMGRTKNAVVGKAHRLKLPSRPSPIVKADPNAPPQSKKPKAALKTNGPTLAPLGSLAKAPAQPAASHRRSEPFSLLQAAMEARASTVGPHAPRSVPVGPQEQPRGAKAPEAAPGTPMPYGRVTACAWPNGEPGARGFHFCGANSVPGKPYCEEHAKRAYLTSSRP